MELLQLMPEKNVISGLHVNKLISKFTCVSAADLLTQTADTSFNTAVSGTHDDGIRLFIMR